MVLFQKTHICKGVFCMCVTAVLCMAFVSCKKGDNTSSQLDTDVIDSSIASSSMVTSSKETVTSSDTLMVSSKSASYSVNSSKASRPIASSKIVSSEDTSNSDPRSKVLPDLNMGKVLRTVPNGIQLLMDPTFGGGFTAMQATGTSTMGSLTFAKNSVARPWLLYQNNSKFILNRDSMPSVDGKIVYYQNQGKKISREVNNDQSVTLGMAVYASKEYDEPRKQASDPWVHLMAQQDFENLMLKDYSNFVLSLDVRVPYFKINMSEDDYNPNIMCAQHNIYFIIKNTNINSKGFNDWFWFGINMYDNRKPVASETLSMDTGFEGATNTVIYVPDGSKVFGTQSTHDGKWHSLSYDVKPEIIAALNKAQNRGLFTNTTADDLKIVNMYFSWEVSGGFDCEILYKNIGFFGVK